MYELISASMMCCNRTIGILLNLPFHGRRRAPTSTHSNRGRKAAMNYQIQETLNAAKLYASAPAFGLMLTGNRRENNQPQPTCDFENAVKLADHYRGARIVSVRGKINKQ